MKIAILDYGMGNLQSVSNTIFKIGFEATVIQDPEIINLYDGLILPGVGAFPQAIQKIKEASLDDAMLGFIKSGRPLLGICLGMQLMCNYSDEGGKNKGLEWFDADILHFPKSDSLNIPHMGWNTLKASSTHKIFTGVERDLDVYFLHSYFARPNKKSEVLATTVHGVEFASMLARDNLCAMQFHPEKSHHVGLQLIKNFFMGGSC